MKSNIYYFDETGKQKDENKIKNIQKLQSKSYLNIFFYAWFIICILFIVLYMIAYMNSNANQMKNKKLVTKKKEILTGQNNTKDNDKIGLAFIFKMLYNNEIEKMLFLLANKLVKYDKYDIYLITEKGFNANFKFDKKIKKFSLISNRTMIEEFDKTSNIKYYFLQNELSRSTIKWYQSLNGGKKVLGIMNKDFLSYIYSNLTSTYPLWKNSILYDAFINLIPDDYYFYKKLGLNNTFYIPYLYPFDAKAPIAKLTHKNLIIMGKEKDLVKGGIYGIKAMSLIVEKIPDAMLYLISTSNHIKFLEDLIKELKLQKNIQIFYNVENVTKIFLNSSVVLYPPLSEYYPYIMNLAKSHAIPIVGFNLSYNPAYQKGVELVNMFDYKQMANKAIKLLNNYEYRKIKGLEAKLSLNEYSNRETMDKWEKLLSILEKDDIEEYAKFQENTYKEYYDEKTAKERLEYNFHNAKKFNKNFFCHSFKDMINLNYITNIKEC